MNHTPLIFLGVFASMALSWFGMVVGPQLQLGGAQPVAIEGARYPVPRAGLAQQGAEIYRSLGCNQCHSQQVRQQGVEFGAILTDLGETPDDIPAVLFRRLNIVPNLDAAKQLTNNLPVTLRANVALSEAEFATRVISEAGGKAEITFRNLGPELERGWGARMSVADDYLYDQPVLLGAQRLGPDLANIATRAPEKFVSPWKFASTNHTDERVAWHFAHLYNPRAVSPGSVMPAYTWLFETRRIGRAPSAEALVLSKDALPAAGWEVVPKDEAKALVAYLLSLRSDVALPHAPVPRVARAPVAPAATNAPAAP
jgi:cbb3-type cytochrome oxidase cytochrome c subunit